MGKSVLFLVINTFFLLLSIGGIAQFSNLSQLAQGDLVAFAPIREIDDAIFGYVAIYDLGEVDKDKENYEYVILDNNLNEVSNGKFHDQRYRKVLSRFLSPSLLGQKLLLSKTFLGQFGNNKAFVSNRFIDLETNTVETPFYLKGDKIVEGERDAKGLGKEQRKTPIIDVLIPSEKGFMTYPIDKLGRSNSKTVSSIKFYNLDKELVWEYDYNPNNLQHTKAIVYVDADYLLLSFKSAGYNDTGFYLKRIDLKTGKEDFVYKIETKSSEYNHSFTAKIIDGRTHLLGKISKYSSGGYDYKKAEGFFSLVLDDKGNELTKKYLFWKDMVDHLDIDDKGKVENRYRLHAKEYFIMDNGSMAILTEKLKESYNVLLGISKVKTTDLVLFQFDEDFKIGQVLEINKDKSKWQASDYLYSQYINQNNDLVFFYRDYKKDIATSDKNWIMGIVTIVDGKINHETISISSEDHFIYPYIAKEGYVLFREYNKDADYDEIRLEQINY
ncbi:MAG: DUF6770 family protein [Bacteroidota bacterium]